MALFQFTPLMPMVDAYFSTFCIMALLTLRAATPYHVPFGGI
jgi:hypothetical protein